MYVSPLILSIHWDVRIFKLILRVLLGAKFRHVSPAAINVLLLKVGLLFKDFHQVQVDCWYDIVSIRLETDRSCRSLWSRSCCLVIGYFIGQLGAHNYNRLFS